MLDLMERVMTLPHSRIQWGFSSAGPRFPVGYPEGDKCRDETQNVDPFPCYAHDTALVFEMAEKVEEAFPIGLLPIWHILPFEVSERANGFAYRYYFRENEEYVRHPYIVLSGKRIPLHPAVTRYLCAHEYAHCVQWWIEKCRGIDSDSTVTDFDREYAEMRGCLLSGEYGALNWHSNIGEIIANDFRIVVCGVEADFWPHDVLHPSQFTDHRVEDFWSRLHDECAFDPDAAEDEEE